MYELTLLCCGRLRSWIRRTLSLSGFGIAPNALTMVGFSVVTRENEGTERDAQGVGRDMSCPRKLFLDERKSGFRDVRRQHCLALRFLVKRENGDIRGWLVNIFIHHVFSKGN